MKVLFVASEATPFASSGGLGDVAGSLPAALKECGSDVRLIMPLYGSVPEEYRARMRYLTNFYIPVAWRSQYCGLFELIYHGTRCYFLDNEYYFKRPGLYGYYDDGERYAFFSRAVLEAIKYMDFGPDIIHCNDWQSALVPVYLNAFYRSDPTFYGIKTLFPNHNIQYQGKYGMDVLDSVVGLPVNQRGTLEFAGCVNYMKGAIVSCDRVNTVSYTYAQEILDPWFAYGLDGLLRDNSFKLSGVLNGIDVVSYNPETDKNIAANYSADDPRNKIKCKNALLEEFSLPVNDEPVIGIVSRLVAHKGFDLVKHVLNEILDSGMKVVVLGSGEYMYESCFWDFASRYKERFGLYLGFEPKLARQIYAGSDMFLMPSKSEPCGLSQLIALRYGSVPIVREVGGLKDTITDSGDGQGNGFTFKSYNAHDMLDACRRAGAAYKDKQHWKVLVDRALRCDFSWSRSAKEYQKLYESMVDLW